MPVISTVGGPENVDRRRGFSDGRQPTAEENAAWNRRREENLAFNLAIHPSNLRRQQLESERERERQRKLDHPDPRAELRAAHALRQEARNELRRIEGLHQKSADLVLDLEAQHGRLVEQLHAGTRAAGSKLVEALANGMESLPTSPRTDGLAASAQACAGRLTVAKEALAQLQAQVETARRALSAAEAGVSAAIVVVGVSHAAASAAEIERLDQQLAQRRRDLWSLSSALTFEARPLPPALPASVGRAIAGALDGPVDGTWAEKLKQLHSDPEASLE